MSKAKAKAKPGRGGSSSAFPSSSRPTGVRGAKPAAKPAAARRPAGGPSPFDMMGGFGGDLDEMDEMGFDPRDPDMAEMLAAMMGGSIGERGGRGGGMGMGMHPAMMFMGHGDDDESDEDGEDEEIDIAELEEFAAFMQSQGLDLDGTKLPGGKGKGKHQPAFPKATPGVKAKAAPAASAAKSKSAPKSAPAAKSSSKPSTSSTPAVLSDSQLSCFCASCTYLTPSTSSDPVLSMINHLLHHLCAQPDAEHIAELLHLGGAPHVLNDECHCGVCGSIEENPAFLLQHLYDSSDLNKSDPYYVEDGDDKADADDERADHTGYLVDICMSLSTIPSEGVREALIDMQYMLLGKDVQGDEEDEEEDESEEDEPPIRHRAGGGASAAKGGKKPPARHSHAHAHDSDPEEDEGEEMDEIIMQQMMRAMGMSADGMPFGAKTSANSAKNQKKKAKKKAKAAASATDSPSSSSTAPSTSSSSAGLECGQCHGHFSKELYSAAQLKKKGARKCKDCVDGKHPTPTKSAAAPLSSSAHASSASKSSPAPSNSSSSSTSSTAAVAPVSPAHTAELDYTYPLATRTRIEVLEEVELDAVEEEEDGVISIDTAKPNVSSNTTAKPNAASTVTLTKSILPRVGASTCIVCRSTAGSFLINDWQLVCQQCCEMNGMRLYGPQMHESYEVSATSEGAKFPSHRLGVTHCTRAECGSDQLILAYDEREDEYVICVGCKRMRQQVRVYNKYEDVFVEDVGVPEIYGQPHAKSRKIQESEDEEEEEDEDEYDEDDY